eukprot:scaffold26885_cov112-Isochrysis_galbana.AAC.3
MRPMVDISVGAWWKHVMAVGAVNKQPTTKRGGRPGPCKSERVRNSDPPPAVSSGVSVWARAELLVANVAGLHIIYRMAVYHRKGSRLQAVAVELHADALQHQQGRTAAAAEDNHYRHAHALAGVVVVLRVTHGKLERGGGAEQADERYEIEAGHGRHSLAHGGEPGTDGRGQSKLLCPSHEIG